MATTMGYTWWGRRIETLSQPELVRALSWAGSEINRMQEQHERDIKFLGDIRRVEYNLVKAEEPTTQGG